MPKLLIAEQLAVATDRLREIAADNVPRFIHGAVYKSRAVRRAAVQLEGKTGLDYLLHPDRKQLNKDFCITVAPYAGLMCVAAAGIIYASDGTPIIHRNKRVGQNEVPFEMFKLRSMYIDHESRFPSHLENRRYGIIPSDPRLIPHAALLRGGLDEASQWFNIRRGQMSWWGLRATEVGERDLWARQWPGPTEEFTEWMQVRHLPLPALFGYDGIRRRRGDNFTTTTLPERRDLDYRYIYEDASLEFDLHTMCEAIGAVLRHGSHNEAAPLQSGDLEV